MRSDTETLCCEESFPLLISFESRIGYTDVWADGYEAQVSMMTDS